MIVHESGHVIGAWATGAKVQKVVLHPLEFSRTDVLANRHPLTVAWAGPLLGSVLPLLAFATAAAMRMPGLYVLRFFVGFCLVANGAHIGGGSFDHVGDTRDMLLFGSPRWLLWMFGAAAVASGLLLWNRLGPRFGLGPSRGRVNPVAAYVTLSLLALMVAAELLFGSTG